MAIILITMSLFILLASCQKKRHKYRRHKNHRRTGRSVTIPNSPERVAALIGSFADVWILSGGELSAAANDAWEDFGLTLEYAVNIGGAHSPSLEILLSANPDLVLASASTASNIALKDTLEAASIPVLYFDVDNFNDYLNMLD